MAKRKSDLKLTASVKLFKEAKIARALDWLVKYLELCERFDMKKDSVFWDMAFAHAVRRLEEAGL